MSLSYLDESDTDEEGGKVSKCYSEIEISEAQSKCSDLKGTVMTKAIFRLLSALWEVKNFVDCSYNQQNTLPLE